MIINNHQLHVEVHGAKNAPVVVFIHHGLGSVRAWRAQIPEFVNSGYRVIVYDRWGYGQSEPRPYLDVPYFENDLADLYTLLETLKVERSTLVGHSDGGTLALFFANIYPERATCLVIVAAHIYLEPKMEPGILGIKAGFEHDERFRKGMRLAHGEKFQSVFSNWYDGWHNPEAQDWDMRPLLPDILCPTLVVQGEDDEHATPQHAIDIAAGIPGSELWIEPGAGHMLPQDKPTLFNQRVIDFLRVRYHVQRAS